MELPDLSHLTEEEQATILKVIKRQQDEDAKEKAMIKTLHEQFENYKDQVKKASENAALEEQQSPDDVKDLCALCHKTKITEGGGHTCSYCSMIFCSRCGGRVTVKSNKNERMVMWVCTLCRKQQEMLTKTGAWYRTEQNRSNLNLKLEPIPNHEIGKMTGSVSLAQLESNNLANNKLKTTYSPKLKKGASEPQLANCEKSPDVPPSTELKTNPNTARKSNETPDNPTSESKEKSQPPSTSEERLVDKGVRRSSTQSEKRLRRQEQALGEQNGNPVTSKAADIGPNSLRTKNTLKSAEIYQSNYRVPKQKVLESAGNISRIVVNHRNPSQKIGNGQPETTKATFRSSGTVPNALQPPKRPHDVEGEPLGSTRSSNDLRAHSSNIQPGYISDRPSKSASSDSCAEGFKFSAMPKVGNNTSVLSSSHGVSESSSNRMISSSHTPRVTQSDVEEFAFTQSQRRSYRSDENISHSADTQQRTESMLPPTSRRDVNSQSPRSNRASSRIHRSPILGARHCRGDSPTLPHSHADHDAPSHRRSHGRHQVHHQGQHCSYSPTRKEVRKYPMRAARCKDWLSDNEGSEYAEHCCHPFRKHRDDSSGSHLSVSSSTGDHVHHMKDCWVGLLSLVEHGLPQKGPREQLHQLSDYPSLVEFDDVASRSYSSPHRRDVCGHVRDSKGELYHSDLALQRSAYNCSSEDNICSNRCHGNHNSLSRRRNNSRHGPDHHFHFRKNHRQKSRGGKHVRRKTSLSSTDDEIQSTPDYSSCDESEKAIGFCRGGNPALFVSTESGYYSSNVNQTNEKSSLHVVEHDSIRSNTNNNRDSGVDTGSSVNTVHSDDTAKDQPVAWQPSTDGRHLIGRMVLDKRRGQVGRSSMEAASVGVLGVKVIGGKLNEDGELTAYVAMVKRGSVADTVGRLKQGDEVIMWNEYCLRGATYEEVYKAISDSKDSKTISLVVCRPIDDVPRIPETRQRHQVTESSSGSFESQKREEEVVVATKAEIQQHQAPPRLLENHSMSPSKNSFPGKLQVRIWYDQSTLQLYVTAMSAVGLSLRPGGLMRNPYIKMYLLPDRSDMSKRRTKTAKKTINPVWDQSFLYGQIKRQDLGSMALEISLWDLDRSVETNGHFLGEVLIDLALAPVDDVPQWYKLMPVGQGMNRVTEPVAKQHPSRVNQHGSNEKIEHSMRYHDDAYRKKQNGRNPETAGHPERTNFIDSFKEFDREAEFSNDNRRVHKHYQAPNYPMHQDDISPASSVSFIHAPSHLNDSQRPTHGRTAASVHQSPRKQKTAAPNSQSTSPRRSLAGREESNRVLPNIKGQHSTSRSSHRLNVEAQPLPSKGVDQTDGRGKAQHPQQNSVASSSSRGRSRRLSADNVKRSESSSSEQRNVEEAMSKSVSLSANLHAQNKSKTLGSKSASSSSHTSPLSNNSPTARRNNSFLPQKFTNLVSLKNRSQSSSTLEASKRKGQTSSARCSEFGIDPTQQREGYKESGSGSLQSIASEGAGRTVDQTLYDFVGGFGVGQLVGRQALAMSCLGEIKLSIRDTGAGLEVEVFRARNLVLKTNAKVLPAVHIKVYLMFEKQCSAKLKTKVAKRSLDPEFNQVLTFEPNQYGNSIQVMARGDYGRLDSKAFLGIAQIQLYGPDSPKKQQGWYKLFPASSLLETSLLDDAKTGSKTSLESNALNYQG